MSCKRWSKLHQDVTIRVYLSKCGINHMLFCWMKQGIRSQHMVCGVDAGILFRWGIVFLLVCIRHYSSTGRWRWRKERKHTLISCVWRLVCLTFIQPYKKVLQTVVKSRTLWQTQSTWPLQERDTSGNINFTCCLPTMGETTWTFLSQMFNIKCRLSLACKFVWNYLISSQSGKNLAV